MYPEHDLSSRKDFIKKAVKKVKGDSNFLFLHTH